METSISLDGTRIAGLHTGSVSPEGNIIITQSQREQIDGLRAQSVASGLSGEVHWVNSAPELPVDTRPEIGVLINDSATDTMLMVGQPFDVQLSITGFEGNLIVPVFDRRFLYTFVNGIATKTVTLNESALYELKNNTQFKVVTPLVIEVVE